MQYPTQTYNPSLAVDGTHLAATNVAVQRARNFVHAVIAWFAELRASIDRNRRATAARDALSELDDRMLRDLGLHRSEVASLAAEYAGQAEVTRMRAVDPTFRL